MNKIKMYIYSLHYRNGIGQTEGLPSLNKYERKIMLIDYWLTPFYLNWNNLYSNYSELFLINSIKLGKYRKYL